MAHMKVAMMFAGGPWTDLWLGIVPLQNKNCSLKQLITTALWPSHANAVVIRSCVYGYWRLL